MGVKHRGTRTRRIAMGPRIQPSASRAVRSVFFSLRNSTDIFEHKQTLLAEYWNRTIDNDSNAKFQ